MLGIVQVEGEILRTNDEIHPLAKFPREVELKLCITAPQLAGLTLLRPAAVAESCHVDDGVARLELATEYFANHTRVVAEVLFHNWEAAECEHRVANLLACGAQVPGRGADEDLGAAQPHGRGLPSLHPADEAK